MGRIKLGAAACLMVLGLAACRGDAATDAEVAGFTPLPGKAAGQAVGLADARSADEAVRQTLDVARRGGVHISTGRELMGYAMDAQRKSTQMRLDSEEFAQMLLSLGFPFRDLPNGTAADRDEGMLKAVDPEDRSEVRREVGEVEQAAREARRGANDAAREAHQAQMAALMDGPRARMEAARAELETLSSARRDASGAEREAIDARIVAARKARSEAQTAYSAARTEARGLERAYAEAREAAFATARGEDAAARVLGRNHAAGRQLMELLAAWVRAAAEDPEHPDSFVPLYLAGMARQQADPIDLAAAPDARRHRWSLLEMALFVAAFTPEPRPGGAVAGAPQASATPTQALLDFVLPPAHAASTTPCEVAKDAWGSWGDAAETANGQAFSALMDKEFTRLYGEGAAEAIGKAISSLSIVGKLAKLAAFYSDTQVAVEADRTEMHKPQAGKEPVTYTARVGVSPEELEAYEKAVKEHGMPEQAFRDCLGWVDLPTSDSIKDVAKEAEDWYLDWRLDGNGHAHWSRRDNSDAEFFGGGRIGKPMKRVSDSSVESSFMIRVLPEAGHSGPQKTGQVVVRAEVDSAGMPSLSNLFNATKGALGIAEAVVDIGTGWIREIAKPKAYAVLKLEYHCPNPTTIHHYVDKPVAWGNGEGGEGCTFEFASRQDFEEWREEHGL